MRDYRGAADAFLMWNKQRDRQTGNMNVLRGLTRRREEERAMFNA
jgi:GH24 family phage-related lysozyme (muramidase)